MDHKLAFEAAHDAARAFEDNAVLVLSFVHTKIEQELRTGKYT